MAQNFTEAVSQALQESFQIAQEMKATEVTDNHLLKAFLDDPEGYFASILSNLGGDPIKLLNEVEATIGRLPTYSSPTAEAPQPGRSLQGRIQDAQAIMKEWNDTYLATDHFLLSTGKTGGSHSFHGRRRRAELKRSRRAGEIGERRSPYGFSQR